MNRIIAERLVSLRGTRSREEAASAIGISVSALQMYENARRIPRDDIKVKLAEYYGVSVQELFFDSQSHEMCDSVNTA
ncbi:helix-turn-helix transcriptional regulator [Alicyclobacillus suci]|uniref:helix-turn-helix transcriptional regulator n=1 Tax=Alicyclobacillus suci TaxID=2816080 RepID=UPI001A905A8A|nr:helix-turn-helix transcriptional regulator [Alicyclobacillus suci]